jgi:uncharacterized membrane protein
MKLFGHPVHMMVVHFPSALIPMDLVLNAIGMYTHDVSFIIAGFYCLVGGAVLGWAAVVFGAADLLTISAEREKTIRAALIHGGVNTTVVICATVIAWMQYKKLPIIAPPAMLWLGVRALLVAVLLIGNYVGGNLVLKHRLGVHH